MCTGDGGAPFCATTASDNANCGACGNACGAEQVCQGGACVTSCSSTQTLCGVASSDAGADASTDASTDASSDASGDASRDGGGAYCANFKTDNANCGGCGVICGAGQICSAGACASECVTGQTTCTVMGSTYCANLQSDNANCGTCGTACSTSAVCVAGMCVSAAYYTLTGTVDPTTVFNTIEQTYSFPNNLTNSIWNRLSNVLITGEFSTNGYWSFPVGTTGYSGTPNVASVYHERMVQVPATNTVVYDVVAASDGVGPGTAANFKVATISNATGALSGDAAAVFSDGFTGSCQLTSSSATEFLCYDGTNVRLYATAAGSATLTYERTVTLGTALPTAARCNANASCYGSTFAWDGAYYYFAADEGSSNNLMYLVYNPDGSLKQTVTATGGGSLNGLYFDWSVARYASHDGFGGRSGGALHSSTGGNSDTQVYSPVSTKHSIGF